MTTRRGESWERGKLREWQTRREHYERKKNRRGKNWKRGKLREGRLGEEKSKRGEN
jgi:hypothetical protein